jgi:hypothetical protein
MASIFRRGKQGIWCIKYYVNGRQAYYSLNTTDARIAKKMKRQIEGEEAKGELLAPSKTPLPVFLEDFCRFLATIRTPKSYSADISVLRVFFGPYMPGPSTWKPRKQAMATASQPATPGYDEARAHACGISGADHRIGN